MENADEEEKARRRAQAITARMDGQEWGPKKVSQNAADHGEKLDYKTIVKAKAGGELTTNKRRAIGLALWGRPDALAIVEEGGDPLEGQTAYAVGAGVTNSVVDEEPLTTLEAEVRELRRQVERDAEANATLLREVLANVEALRTAQTPPPAST